MVDLVFDGMLTALKEIDRMHLKDCSFAFIISLLSISQGVTEPINKDVIYGMRCGLALLMDIHYPEESNGYGIVFIPGSGWHAAFDYNATPLKESGFAKRYVPPLTEAGYTVFVVNHRAAPRFQYPAALEDVQRAIRFVREHANDFKINSERIGGVGGSSGGHLISLLGVMDGGGNPASPNRTDRHSSKLQAVFARAAPTDLISQSLERSGSLSSFLGMRLHPRQRRTSVEYQLYWQASPTAYVTPDDPPFLLIHGDADDRVPFSQSERFLEKLSSVGVDAKLVRVSGGGHGATFPGAKSPPDYLGEMVRFFDRKLVLQGKSIVKERVRFTEEVHEIERNITYGMYSGLALLMDVYKPREPNGFGIIHLTGSGWHSGVSYDAEQQKVSRQVKVFGKPLVEAGYTLFALNHRTAPMFKYPGPLEDVKRAVKFIRYNAERWGIDSKRLGAVGGSSGGHMTALLATVDEQREVDDPDPVNNQSARIQCAVSWAGVHDLVRNAGKYGSGNLSSFLGMRLMDRDSQTSRQYKVYREASPIEHVSSDDPPLMLIHGDADPAVPIEQSEIMLRALETAGVKTRLLRIPEGGHGALFPGRAADAPDYQTATVMWFNQYLK